MKCLTSLAAVAGVCSAAALSKPEAKVAAAIADIEIRALPNAPDGYAPANVSCPSTKPSVRLAKGLNSDESKFLDARRKVTVPAMQDFLKRMNINSFNVDDYFNKNTNTSNLPNIGIAVSGGGYRALLNGAGAIKAFDGREANATMSGRLGGLLQASTYVAGLSGGSWLTGSIFVNNFSTISNLISEQSSTWEFQNSIFKGPDHGGIQILSTADYYSTFTDQVKDKKNAGYNTTITDYWGRALSFQLVNATKGGPSYTWSSIRDNDGFSTGQQPFPIVVADERRPDTMVVAGNSSIFEFTPYEMGTWDPTIYGFVPLEYLGGNFTNGKIPDNEQCVRGFDNAGFVMGTSSTLFNGALVRLGNDSKPSFLQDAIRGILTDLSDNQEDIASYKPNPFYKWNPTSYNAQPDDVQLSLVDGGEDGQNVPFYPLIQPARDVDVIFAVDSSADTKNDYAPNWPNGASLIATYQRSQNGTGIANGTQFPAVPDNNTFINLGLNQRPTFFGCNASNTTSPTPLIVYLPNSPYTFMSNWSTFKLDYTTDERDSTIANGYNVVTRANSTTDPEWSQCVGCAILSRSWDRTKTTVPDQCKSCFTRYCWNGTIANSNAHYEPSIANTTNKKSGAESLARPGTALPTAVAAAVALMFFL